MFRNVILFGFIITYPLLFNGAFGQEVEFIDSIENDIRSTQDFSSKKDTIKERLDTIVEYNSVEQYHELKTQKSFLVSEASIKYTDLEIQADYIEIDWEKGEVYAVGKVDSTGSVIAPARFKQSNKEFFQESLRFNFRSKQGIAYNVTTIEEDGILVAEQVKRKNDSISLLRGAEYTTDPYFKDGREERPDFTLYTRDGKLIDRGDKGKTIVTGPIFFRIYDVVTPIFSPIGAIVPLSNKKKAGILVPSFGEREDQGFFLQNLGLYVPVSDYADVTLLTDFYTGGSYGLSLNSDYRLRYKFNGNLNFDFDKIVNGIQGLSNFSESNQYRFSWTHNQDPKANPYLVLSANVNINSSEFFRNSLNNQALFNGTNVNTSANSSVNINKRFEKIPKLRANLSLRHSQNNNSESVNLNLPILTINVDRIYPFAPKSGTKKGLIQNLAFTPNATFQNSINTNLDDFLTNKMFDTSRNTATHNLNFQTGTTVFNFFPLNFNVPIRENWTLETRRQRFDTDAGAIVTDTISGFDAFRTFSLSTNIQTTVYGTKIFKERKDEKPRLVKAFRHLINPVLGFSYTPDFSEDFWGYFDTFEDGDGQNQSYSRFFELGSAGTQANITYALNNTFEAKVRSREDSVGYKKIKIFDKLDFSGNYNIAADSLNFSTIRMSASTPLLDNKLRINYTAVFNPYKLVFTDPAATSGIRIDELDIPDVQSFSTNFSYGLSNQTFASKNKKESQYQRVGKGRYDVFKFNKDGYAKFAIPWNLNLNFNLNYNKGNNRETTTASALGINGNLQPTPHWSISGRASYDISEGEFTNTSFTFSRDLRSFDLNFSWRPFGVNRTWDFFIGIKSQILSDTLKYNERNFPNSSTNF